MKWHWLLTGILLATGAVHAQQSIYEECDAKVEEIQREKDELTREYKRTSQEINRGEMCSRCSRTKSAIERGNETFQAHLTRVDGEVIYPTAAQLRAEAQKAYDKYKSDWERLDEREVRTREDCNERIVRHNERLREEAEAERQRQMEEARRAQEEAERQAEEERKREEEEQRRREEEWQRELARMEAERLQREQEMREENREMHESLRDMNRTNTETALERINQRSAWMRDRKVGGSLDEMATGASDHLDNDTRDFLSDLSFEDDDFDAFDDYSFHRDRTLFEELGHRFNERTDAVLDRFREIGNDATDLFGRLRDGVNSHLREFGIGKAFEAMGVNPESSPIIGFGINNTISIKDYMGKVYDNFISDRPGELVNPHADWDQFRRDTRDLLLSPLGVIGSAIGWFDDRD